MVSITLHRIEKIKIEKYWLDSETFVCKFEIRDTKNVRNEITLFSKSSEYFTDITSNINSKSE